MTLVKLVAWQVLLMSLLMPLLVMPLAYAKDNDELIANVAAKVNKDKRLPLPQVSLLPINDTLLTLLVQLEQPRINNKQIEISLAQLTLTKAPLNAAEQYLLLLAQALRKEVAVENNRVSNNIIELLQQADKLSEYISEQQLCQPNFLQLHLMLAKHYAKQGQFDLAYLEQKSYLKKHEIYRKNKRKAMISSLEQSFEVTDKKATNALLESQIQLKVRHVSAVQQQKASQQYNFTLIISTAFVFVLMFFRQLRIRNKLLRLISTDALTGLANRSALFEQGEKLVVTFAENPQEFSVLLLDLDHFKSINDNFGHQVGDEILIIVARLVKETMRTRDEFYRLGGEEFVALLPFADNNKAKAIAMRINEKIAQYDFDALFIRGKVTVSIGVAAMLHNQQTFDDVLHGADLAMYQAKKQGRNTVVSYQSISDTQERRTNSHSS